MGRWASHVPQDLQVSASASPALCWERAFTCHLNCPAQILASACLRKTLPSGVQKLQPGGHNLVVGKICLKNLEYASTIIYPCLLGTLGSASAGCEGSAAPASWCGSTCLKTSTTCQTARHLGVRHRRFRGSSLLRGSTYPKTSTTCLLLQRQCGKCSQLPSPLDVDSAAPVRGIERQANKAYSYWPQADPSLHLTFFTGANKSNRLHHLQGQRNQIGSVPAASGRACRMRLISS